MPKRRTQTATRNRKPTTVFRRFTKADNEKNLKRLKCHVRSEGAVDLKQLEAGDPELAGWYLYTRSHLRDLSEAELSGLCDIGFFTEKECAWLKNYHKLVIFKEVMGHTRVPARWQKNKQLSSWVHGLRSPRRETPDHFRQLLDHIGFEWKLRDKAPVKAWEERYAELCTYKGRFGDCEVPAKWAENTALGSWVSTQRLNKQLLTDTHIKKLDAIGFNWDILGNRWDEHYKALCAFKKAYGHCRVAKNCSEYPGLWIWVANLRRRNDHLTKAQRTKLTRLGFSWHPDADSWQKHFEAYRQFVQMHGHPLVPAKKMFLGVKLGVWVNGQRQSFKQGSLKPEYKALLDNCDDRGFAWNVEEWTWEQRFAELEEFAARFGHCRVPAKAWLPNPALGSWLSTQRSRWDTLPATRRKRLERLGVERSVPIGVSIPANVSEYLKKLKHFKG